MKDGGVWRNFGSEWTYKYLDMGFIVCLLFVSFVLENFTMPRRNTRVKQEIPADIRCLFLLYIVSAISTKYTSRRKASTMTSVVLWMGVFRYCVALIMRTKRPVIPYVSLSS